jgi:ribonuclease BN (tRNA processing enzyme)
MRITFLGTGDSFGSGGRHPISILVRANGFSLLLDCGPGFLPAMKQIGYSPSEIDAVFISHHHGDHFAGVPFLLLEYQYRTSRERPLTVAGPPATGEKIIELTHLLFPGLGSKERRYELSFMEIEHRRSEKLGTIEVTPFRVSHFPEGVAFGFRVNAEGRTLVYSGDTAWTDELAQQSKDADLLVCECSTFSNKVDFHMSHDELLLKREDIKARRVLLIHAGDDVLARRSDLAFDLAEDGQEVQL